MVNRGAKQAVAAPIQNGAPHGALTPAQMRAVRIGRAARICTYRKSSICSSRTRDYAIEILTDYVMMKDKGVCV